MSSICVVEDHRMLADTLAAELARQGLDTAVVVPDPGRDLLADVLATAPQLVLLDLDLGGGRDGVTLVGPLVAAGVKVLLMTGTLNMVRVAAGLEAGALGYQPKSAGFDALLASTGQALNATGAINPPQRARLLDELARARQRRAETAAPLQLLTGRERAALEELTCGVAVTQMSLNWSVSEATVRTHVRCLLTKLGVRSQLEAVALANRNRWFARPPRV